MKIKPVAAFVAVGTLALASSALSCATAFAEEYAGPVWTSGESIVKKENITIKSKGTGIKFEDSKATGAPAVECTLTDEGKIGAEGKDEVTSVLASECKPVKSCEAGTISATALHLPWKTQLEEGEGLAVRDRITSGGTGEPGWLFECKVLGIKIIDECVGPTTTGTSNVSGGVNLTFDSKSTHLKCSLGGTEAGIVTGTDLEENKGESQVRAMNMYAVEVTPADCTITMTQTTCTILIKNLSLVLMLVVKKEILGTVGNERFKITSEGCTSLLELGARNPAGSVGGSCADVVSLGLPLMTGWENEFLGAIESLTGHTRSATMLLLT